MTKRRNIPVIIDRRKNQAGKSDTIRNRFLERHKAAVKTGVRKTIVNRKIRDTVNDGAEIKVNEADTKEWTFGLDHRTGVWRGVNPGNTKYRTGDCVLKPPGAPGAGGNQGSPDGDGEDDFIFNITKDELEEYFFDELALPDLVKQNMANVEEWKRQRSGFSTIGLPCNLDLPRSFKNSLGREMAMLDDDENDESIELEDQLEKLVRLVDKTPEQVTMIEELRRRIDQLSEEGIGGASVDMDKMDLRYRSHTVIPVPNTRAVMFCVMDVSGSMGEHHKTISKYFYLLLFMFLSREYQHVDIRFIRHHHVASEVDEEEFFNSRETGGTVVSVALDKMLEIIDNDYNDGTWNIYGAQCSDGDNWPTDTALLQRVMIDRIMPSVQYYAYIEVLDPDDRWRTAGDTEVWNTYEPIKEMFANLDLATVTSTKDIFPVFAELFSKNRQRRKTT